MQVGQFDDIWHALLTVFSITMIDGWSKLMYQCQDVQGKLFCRLYFTTIILLGGIVLVSSALAMICVGYFRSSADIKHEEDELEKDKDNGDEGITWSHRGGLKRNRTALATRVSPCNHVTRSSGRCTPACMRVFVGMQHTYVLMMQAAGLMMHPHYQKAIVIFTILNSFCLLFITFSFDRSICDCPYAMVCGTLIHMRIYD